MSVDATIYHIYRSGGKVTYAPQHVTKRDETIVAWDDVPVAIQKKILSGTMTEEDWDSEWETSSPVAIFGKVAREHFKDETDIVPESNPKHTNHVYRREYDKCMIIGCGHVRPD
jgi:hypothetical protein